MEDVIVYCLLSKINCQHRRAFTLLELFLVIGALGVVASIVILVIRPGRQLGDTRNMRRYADINTIANAIDLYANDNGAAIPSGIDSTLRMIGTATGGCAVQCGSPVVTTTVTLSPCLSLTGALVPTYLSSIPFDPLFGSPERSYYAIQETPQRNLLIRSCAAELEKTVEVTR